MASSPQSNVLHPFYMEVSVLEAQRPAVADKCSKILCIIHALPSCEPQRGAILRIPKIEVELPPAAGVNNVAKLPDRDVVMAKM